MRLLSTQVDELEQKYKILKSQVGMLIATLSLPQNQATTLQQVNEAYKPELDFLKKLIKDEG